MQNAIAEELEPWEIDDDEIILSEVFDSETLAALAMIEAGATYEQIEKSRAAHENAARRDGEAGALEYRQTLRERFENSGRDISEFSYEQDLDETHLQILGYHSGTATDARNVTRRHKARQSNSAARLQTQQLKDARALKALNAPTETPQTAPQTAPVLADSATAAPVLKLVPPLAPETRQSDAQTRQIARLLMEVSDAAKTEKRVKGEAREAAKTTKRKMELLREVMAPLAKAETPREVKPVPPIPDRDFLPYLRDAQSVFELRAERCPEHRAELHALWRAGVKHFKQWANAENQRIGAACPSAFILRAWVQWMNYKAHELTNWR